MPNPLYFDRRKQTSTSTGTGAFTLNAATGPWQNLNSIGQFGGLPITYCIVHQTASDWETGVGSVDQASGTLTRSYVLDGSAGPGTFTNFTGGNKDVFSTAIAAALPRIRPSICEGRLTLTSGSATGDTASSSTVYFTPFMGSQIALPAPTTMGQSRWKLYDFTELSTPISGQIANIPFDISILDSGGNLGLSTQQWASATSRSVGLTIVDGIPLVGSATSTMRYLGTVNPLTATTSADTPKQRFCWNYYNQLPRRMANFPNTGTWTITGPYGWRGQNGDATKARAVEFVTGATLMKPINMRLAAYVNCAAGGLAEIGITLDGTGAPSFTDSFAGEIGQYVLWAEYNQIPSLGYHYLQPVEQTVSGSGTYTWYDTYSRFSGGFTGMIWG